MKPVYQRVIAILLLCIPGVVGVYGWTIIREVIFDTFAKQGFQWGRFLFGLVLLLGSLYIVGGFIFYRDKKNKRVQPKLLNKEELEELEIAKKDPNFKKAKFLDKV